MLRRVTLPWSAIAFAFGCGVALALLFDPRRGAARRALLRDKAFSATRRAREALVRRGKDVSHRVRGRVYETTHRGETVPDSVLVERVRAQIGRPVSHPRALEVLCDDGCVLLSGPILGDEVEPLIDIVAKVRGVTSIECQLDVYESEDSIPDLQSGDGAGNRWTPH